MFTGDTLFCAGCGRIFEGTPDQMHASLERLRALPADTRVYCGHEYTENNLRFAAHVEPGERRRDPGATSAQPSCVPSGQPTVGTTLDEEGRTNPFLRVRSREIRSASASRTMPTT